MIVNIFTGSVASNQLFSFTDKEHETENNLFAQKNIEETDYFSGTEEPNDIWSYDNFDDDDDDD